MRSSSSISDKETTGRDGGSVPGAAAGPAWALPMELDLRPLSRRPIKLPDATERFALQSPVPRVQISAGGATMKASIIVVTFNNLAFNKLCLASLLANTDYPNYEVLIADNASTDGTTEYLRRLADENEHIKVIFNDSNRGFAPANNQALAMASGELLILLNNDTIVPAGWLSALTKHLKDRAIGAVGPVTNRICNEAQIEVSYGTYGELLDFARRHSAAHQGQLFDIRMLAMFCMAMRREVYEQVGRIDERFELGMLEDEDYSIRVRAAGYRVVCAEDAFVHHFSEASFGALVSSGEYWRVYAANRRRFEDKWGVEWEPYKQRDNPGYRQLTGQIRRLVREALPPDATVIVVSKGDDTLLDLGGATGWHFPRLDDGRYSGYYPANSAEAIAHLEGLRSQGAQYLLLPNTAFWWLEHYAEFRRHLEGNYRRVASQEDSCMIFDLGSRQRD